MPYAPKEGKMIRDINLGWERLEKAEHERELALREELIRQEKLEQLAARKVVKIFNGKIIKKIYILYNFKNFYLRVSFGVNRKSKGD